MALAELTSLDLALGRFLQEEIAIPMNSRSNAATSQKYLRNILRGKSVADVSFPALLQNNDCDFIGGSFARHTKIWPLDDIDLFFPVEGGNLQYVSNGVRLPYVVVTDGGTSRLTLAKWQTNGFVDSSKVLNGFKTSLKETYPTTDISVDKHCVSVQTTISANSESDGIGFDIVPCLLLRPDYGSAEFYVVPDGAGGWMRSNPRTDTTTCEELQTFHGTYRQAIRLLKYWNKKELGNSFKSYYIELALSKRFAELRAQGTKVYSLSWAFALGFSALIKSFNAGSQASLVSGAHLVDAPYLSENQKNIFTNDNANADRAFGQAWSQQNLAEALATLNVIFSTDFF